MLIFGCGPCPPAELPITNAKTAVKKMLVFIDSPRAARIRAEIVWFLEFIRDYDKGRSALILI
jgi:hypothetical protein